MIRIERPLDSPEVLQNAGKRETQENCESYGRQPDDYRSGTKKFSFNRDIYGHPSVKNTLLQAQHDKCCYCESKFRPTSYGAVEHFRPKGAVQQGQGQNREFPGYYWLAYSWNNLLVSCERCNTCKGSLFPLADPELRARCHHDDVDAEDPLVVDPAREDPRRHIRFRGPAVEPLTERGRETIERLKLDGDILEEERREKLGHLKALITITGLKGTTISDDEVECAQKQLGAAVRPEAKFSAMARDFLEPNGGPNRGQSLC